MRVGKRGLFSTIQQLVCYLFCLWLLPIATVGQDLCNLAGAEKGGFTLLTPAVGCSPLNVKIQDNSGGTDVVYYYYYTGETAAQLGTLTPTTVLENDYFAANEPTVFTILQKGKKNGKDMYACQQVTVRPNNQPLFTYNSCNNRILNLSIPDTLINDFDSYKIDWGDGSSENVLSLPFEGRKDYAIPSNTKQIKVEGVYNTPVGCSSSPFQTINMSEGGNYANIDELEIDKDLSKISLKFDGLNAVYRLYTRELGKAYDISTPLREISQGQFIMPGQVDRQYCFAAFRNSGGCFESSGEVCTVILQDIDKLRVENVIEWSQHPTGIDNTLFGSNGRIESVTYNIIRTNQDNGDIDRFDNVTSPYQDDIDCKINYCYKIETIVEGFPKFGSSINYRSVSISNEICVDRKSFVPPAITDAHSSVISPNSVAINYADNSGWNLVKEKFRLLRFDGDTFIPVDSTNTAASFTDLDVSTAEASSCYQINYTDECGSTSAASPTFCTIHLAEAETNTLGWTSESPFAADNPVTYDIIYLDEATGTPLTETAYPFPSVSHPINLDLFEEFARYQIKAVDANGVESLSNIVEIPIQASIFLPTAFTPNGDGINDELQVKGKTKRMVTYQLTLYNRWGETIFSTTEVGAAWNGTAGTALAPSGNYTYRIEATTNTGETIQKKGTVLLLR